MGYSTLFGPDITPDGPWLERAGYGEVVLSKCLWNALARLDLPPWGFRGAEPPWAVPAG